MSGEYTSKPSWVSGFIAHEELYVVEMEELRHVKAEEVIRSKKEFASNESQLSFSHLSRTQKIGIRMG